MHLCTCVSEEVGDGESASSETSSLLSYTLRYVSFAEVGRVCRVALREPIHLCTCEEGDDGKTVCSETSFLLCTCVSEEGGDRETVCSEMPSLMSYTLRYVSFTEVGSVCRILDTSCIGFFYPFLFIMNQQSES
jgi:hypothetical protein